MHIKYGALIILITATLSGGRAVFASETLNTGLKQYNAGQYRHALITLSLAAEEEPENQMVHYYLADSLVRTGRHKEAIEEYKLCYQLNPTSLMGTYSRQALFAYKQSVPKARLCGSVSETAGETMEDGQSKLITQAEVMIHHEAVFEKSKHQKSGENLASGTAVQAETDIRRIQEEAERDIEDIMMSANSSRGGSSQMSQQMVQEKIDEIKVRAEQRKILAKKTWDKRAEQYKEWSKKRQTALDQVVSNLESQLEETVIHSGVKLQALGTDLYTRYYGTDRATSQMPNVHPAAVRIITQPSAARTIQNEFKAQNNKINNGELSSPKISKNVRASMMH